MAPVEMGNQGDKHPRARQRSRAGFTIIELVVVLGLFAVASSVAIPAYFGRTSVTLNNAAQLLATDIREIQTRAMLYDEELRMRFDEDGGGYRITDAVDEPLVSPYGSGPFQRDYALDAVFRGVKIERVEPASRSLIVDRRGRPMDDLEVTLSFRGVTRTVGLDRVHHNIEVDGLVEPWIDFDG